MSNPDKLLTELFPEGGTPDQLKEMLLHTFGEDRQNLIKEKSDLENQKLWERIKKGLRKDPLESSDPKETRLEVKLAEIITLPTTASQAFQELFGDNPLKLNKEDRKDYIRKMATEFGVVLMSVKDDEKSLKERLENLINKPR